MKAKLIIFALIVASFAESCASGCGNNSWRKRRFVETEHKAPTTNPIATTPVSVVSA